jgi:methylated-DNA-[protein]-cysteine S-methyltransferase
MTGDISEATVDTPVGTLTLVGTVDGLREIHWPDDPQSSAPPGSTPVLDQAAQELSDYFAGRRRSFEVPLDLLGTPFQLRHWASLSAIPYGTTTTYGELAERQGNPRRARAIGAANGRNPVPIVLPCHRVVGADGSLTGFGGGLEVKQFLLDLESRYR